MHQSFETPSHPIWTFAGTLGSPGSTEDCNLQRIPHDSPNKGSSGAVTP